MSILSSLRTLLDFLFCRSRVEEEMEEEFRSHLRRRADDLEREGLSRAEAERQASVEFGGYQRYKEECREALGTRLLQELVADVRYGLRQLARSSAFTTVVIVSLAFGIAANTAIFSLIDAVMLKALPVRNPERLVLLDRTGDTLGVESDNGSPNAAPFTYPTFQEIREHNQVFFSLFGFVPLGKPNINIDGQASLADGELVTGDYFSGLGVEPILGRAIASEDEKPGAPRVAVISYGYWSSQFGRNPQAVGKGIAINGEPFTIVGVAPPEFFGVQPGRSIDIWVPLVEDSKLLPYGMSSPPGGRDPFSSRDWWWLMMMGRLKSGVTTRLAAAQADVLFQQDISDTLKAHPPKVQPHVQLEPASQGLALLRQQFSRPLEILMMIVAVVLLIACTNVATLQVARSAARQREVAVRLSLGASRRRLVRQLLTESILLAGCGGALGLLFAYWGAHALVILMSSRAQPLSGERLTMAVQLDTKVLAFTAGVSVLTGILFGLAPAWRSTRVDLTPALKSSAGRASAVEGRTRLGLGKSLVVAQVALSLLLLVGAGLFVRTLWNLENQNFGFNQRQLLLFGVEPLQAGYKGERRIDFYGLLLRRFQVLPGVRSASMSEEPLLAGSQDHWGISIEGVKPNPPKSGEDNGVDWNFVGPSFFKTMEIPLLTGRGVEWQDTPSSPKVAVVNEALARQFLGGRNPVGYRITFKDFFGKGPDLVYEIVGMVQDAKYGSLRRAPSPTVYAPYSQLAFNLWELHYELRTAGAPLALVPIVRRVVQDLDPNVPISEVKTQSEQIAEMLVDERLFARILGFFGGLAVLLACIGLYGLMAYAVARRTGEIGIRMALGAERGNILGMILRETVAMVAVGVALGIPAALAATRLVSSYLYGLNATDPWTISGSALLMALVALLAVFLPARRAAKVDPIVALRYE